ncbi:MULTISPECIES: hypothetical protein [Weeksellaceae]|uniref:hypothetical protein n=1 Tax=Weeksellaceae TaxID=2762318 RepID=UPI0010247F0A|nr:MULTISPECIES: hypothetical protein [Weeksellaceae]MYY44357.1 hypothetical protein [Elizabethkingia anophelis]UDQ54509.1 hypothetical protein LJF28_02275 [Chryseobacterium indologenes]VFA42959.1 Uncharacterised protein [Chryseobacterium indologenes]
MLNIKRVQKKGDENDEYILLQAASDLNLKNYAVVDRTYSKDKVSNIHRHYYRFESFVLKKGQYVALFSKKGSDKDGTTSSDAYCRYVYWNFDKPILNDSQVESIEVLEVKTIETKKVG